MAKVKRKVVRRTGRLLVTREQLRAQRAQVHSVSIGFQQVMDFGDPTLREAFRLWWHPYDMGPDFDALTGQARVVTRTRGRGRSGSGTVKRVAPVRPVLSGDQIERRKLDPAYFQRIDRAMRSLRVADRKSGRKVRPFRKTAPPSPKPAPVKVVITLGYPLSEERQKVVTIDRKYPGAIFGLAHDFYRELYAEDEKRGGEPGPMKRGQGPLLNRGRGPLVWGHDLGDLSFGRCEYRAFDKKTARALGAEGEFTFGVDS